MGFFEYIFDCIGTVTATLALTIVVAHILTRLFARKKPVKLDMDSFVVLTGGCMGIGRQMALEIAKLYKCSLLIIDRRKDLFDKITEEIKEAGGSCECRFADLADESSVADLNNFLLKRNQPINRRDQQCKDTKLPDNTPAQAVGRALRLRGLHSHGGEISKVKPTPNTVLSSAFSSAFADWQQRF